MPLGFEDDPIDARPFDVPSALLQHIMAVEGSNDGASCSRVRWMSHAHAGQCRQILAMAVACTTLFLLSALWMPTPPFDQRAGTDAHFPAVSLHKSVPESCKPEHTRLGECNGAYPCESSLDLRAAAECCSPEAPSSADSPAGTLFFCSYASAAHGDDVAAFFGDEGVLPPCKLNGIRPLKPDRSKPSIDLRVYGVKEGEARAFSCFNSVREPADRLCIPQQYVTNIDCGTDDEMLKALLSTGHADYVSMRGAPPKFQCFHRGGFGSVGWLHVHSFQEDQVDSICPTLNTKYGMSPNPLPSRYVCADAQRDLNARVQQIREAMQAGDDDDDIPSL